MNLNLSEEMIEVTMRCVQHCLREDPDYEVRSGEEGDAWENVDQFFVDQQEALNFWVEVWSNTSKFSSF
jgi:hypothetical protein